MTVISNEVLVDKLQQLAHCGCKTAMRAVEIFAEDPMYVELDDKIQVMLDWVIAYNITAAETKKEEVTETPEDNDLNPRWLTEEEVVLQQLESEQIKTGLDFVQEDDHESPETSPLKKQKRMGGIHRGPMTGYGVPGSITIHRRLEEVIAGPPFFYFENVRNMPRGEWDSINRHLSSVEPEFTDSRYFAACSRPRGYIHNLPTDGRREISPKAPKTIEELIPGCREYWPEWDSREILNCIVTERATDTVRRKVDQVLELWPKKTKLPSAFVRDQVLKLARRWNLVWTKSGELIPLTINQVEQVMGYDKGHTEVLYSPRDQMKCLGDSFQVNTVGYHFSVLKPLFPQGLRVLSLFAGIGGAEVALQKLGVPITVVVSVESDEKSRRVIERWWKSTHQTGELILQYTDVTDLDRDTLRKLLAKVGGFDLIVGGSPCKNLSALNRCSRTGLAGDSSILFFEFPRILREVRDFMGQKEKKKRSL